MDSNNNNKKIIDIINSIKLGMIKKIIILTGAGISCTTGIPDFRSPGGLYNTLKPELITASSYERILLTNDPVNVVHINMFRKNQFPYLEVRRPFILGTADKKWKPSLAHFFFKILFDKNILQRIYSQNIDGLDFLLNICDNKIINIHGSLAKISCEFCSSPYPIDNFQEKIRTCIKNIYDPHDNSAPKISSNIYCLYCYKPGVKPTTVMYGSQLPDTVWNNVDDDFSNADLLIITGTSLTVNPACNFINKINSNVPRLVINNEMVGENLGLQFSNIASKDSILKGECDDGFLFLASKLGWIDDLYTYKNLMCDNSNKLIEQAYKSKNSSSDV